MVILIIALATAALNGALPTLGSLFLFTAWGLTLSRLSLAGLLALTAFLPGLAGVLLPLILLPLLLFA